MLNKAFLETPDYRTLIETSDRIVVVGRRGTGKSALAIALEKYWRNVERTKLLKLTPEEHHVIGARPLIQLFGGSFSRIRAGSKLLWRYSLMMEAAHALAPRFSFSHTKEYELLKAPIETWLRRGPTIPDRFTRLLKDAVDPSRSPEERIGDLPIKLDLTKIETALASACKQTNECVVFLIDRLDEGYEPDDIGIGLVDGLVQAAIDLKDRLPGVRSIVFLRDNIFRAVQARDPDYTRNIEGHVLRLHWDPPDLLDFAANRLKIALSIHEESSQKVWNLCTTEDLKGMPGFLKCLQLTLYRPRDLMALLNDAFYLAGKQGQMHLSLPHIDGTAKAISENRLRDLQKEYEAIIPGLEEYIGAFKGMPPELGIAEITPFLEQTLAKGSENSLIQQDFLILDDAKTLTRALFTIGFLGAQDTLTGSFVFSHDGRTPDREFNSGDKILIHPCYRMALNCAKTHLEPGEAEEIFDEYDIEVSSETPAIRNAKISQLIQQLEQIPIGNDGDGLFEVWCHKAIRICFAKGLRNVEIKPNKQANTRRDVVALNLGEGNFWNRILQDYGARQVIFEIKNYQDLKADDYYQVLSYLTGEYGRLAFVVTRDDTVDLYSKRDVEWVRSLHAEHKVLIVKLTGKYFSKLLYKLRNPQRHDEMNDALHKILNTYTRLYLAGQTKTEAREEKRHRRKHQRARKASKPTNPLLGRKVR
ncbi:MAG: ATP-binding protein [Acidobacteria bacterium]|nr:ATP-binding protein [Acidobacteriota bacterium]